MLTVEENIKKILITIPTLGAGGMERAALNFAISLNDLGYQVKIFTVSNNIIYFDVPKDIEVISGKKRTKDICLVPSSLYKLRKLSIKFSPDIILSFSGRMSVYVIIALLSTNIPVLPFHRSSPYLTYGKFNNLLNLLLYPKCKAMVVQTHLAKKIFQEKFKNENIIVVPNPIRKMNIDKGIQKDKVIITVSRLVKSKGLDNLIRMFAALNTNDWKLHIIGDGEMKVSLEELALELKVDNKVDFLGFQKDVDYYLSKSSIFAFTSESEGFPNALLEAMCAGLPCISFDCPTGPSDMIIDGENGFLVEMNDHEDYARKLKELMVDEKLRSRFSIEAEKLNEKHNPKIIMERFISDMDGLL